MKPSPFRYHAPTNVGEVTDLLAELDSAQVLAGGQSFVPLLNLRLATVDDIVDLRRVDALRGIERRDGEIWIGAATTQATAERDPIVAEDVPLLARALPLIGHFQIRNRGTIGGSLAHADPAAEIPAVALTLGATIETVSARGERSVPAADFFTGVWTTSLDDDGLVTGVRFPMWEGRCGFAIDEVARRHGDFAIAGACVAVEVDDESVSRCAIGLFGLGPTPLRAADAETSVIGSSADSTDVEALGRAAVDRLDGVPSDLNGTSEYRRRVGAVAVARALRRAIEEASHA